MTTNLQEGEMAKSSRRFVVLILAIVSSVATFAINVSTADLAANNLVVSNSGENKTDMITTNLTLTYTVWLPSFMRNWCPLYIEFTYVPPLGSFQDLQGRVNCFDPANAKVTV